MIPLVVLVVALVILSIAGPLFGADSRDSRDWKPFEWPVKPTRGHGGRR